MRKEQFIQAIKDAGWVARNDGQHSKIAKLYDKWFPKDRSIEMLEHEKFALECKLEEALACQALT